MEETRKVAREKHYRFELSIGGRLRIYTGEILREDENFYKIKDKFGQEIVMRKDCIIIKSEVENV